MKHKKIVTLAAPKCLSVLALFMLILAFVVACPANDAEHQFDVVGGANCNGNKIENEPCSDWSNPPACTGTVPVKVSIWLHKKNKLYESDLNDYCIAVGCIRSYRGWQEVTDPPCTPVK